MHPRSDLLRQILNLTLAIAQWVVGIGSILIPWGLDMATRSAENPSPLTPPGWIFAIWGLIYLACILYAGWQVLPHHRSDTMLRAAGWYSAAAFGLCTVWIPVNQFGPYPATFIVIVPLAVCAWRAFRAVNRIRGKTWQQRYFIQMPLGLFAGWVTLASFVNLASLYTSLHLKGLDLSLTGWATLITLAAGVAAACLIKRARGNLWFAFPILWGLAGAVIENTLATPNFIMACATGLALALATAAVVVGNLRQPLPAA